MTIKAINESNIHDAGSKRPIRQVVPGPVPRVIKKSWRPSRLWVKKSGHVCAVALSGGSALANDPVYRQRAEALHLRSGAIPYGECPVRSGNMAASEFPAELQSSDCDMRTRINPAGRFGEHQCCPHVDYVITVRREKTSEAHQAEERARATVDQQKAQRQEELLSALQDVVIAAVDKPEPERRKRGRPRKNPDPNTE